MRPAKSLRTYPASSEALQLLGPFNREGCHLSEQQAERAIWHLVERYRECKEELAKRPTPAQMRKAHSALLKVARDWEHTKALPGGPQALLEVFHGMTFRLELAELFPSGSKIRTDNPIEALKLFLDEFSRASREQGSAAKDWEGKSWSGRSTPGSFEFFEFEDPNFLLIRGSYALLGACGKPHKISRRGALVTIARSVWMLANPSHKGSAPRFRDQVDSLKQAETRGGALKNNLQHAIDFFIQEYSKPLPTL
jgi:hypothetical protein